MDLRITRPDDWHVHLRDGPALQSVIGHSATRFGRAVVMPNLKPPIATTEQAATYRQRILDAVPAGTEFEPLMTLYLTDRTAVEEIRRARDTGYVVAAKLYPAGATTNAELGVTDIHKLFPVLEAMAREGLLLLVHGEVTDPSVDVFDREAVFIEQILAPLVEAIPELKVVLEHVTTRDGVDFVRNGSGNLAATITAHHLLDNRNALFTGGIRPHFYCLPVLKREEDRVALLAAATSGSGKFFLGTDSAPHSKSAKESSCGCAGIYTAHAATELYAEIFEQANALAKLEGFASHFGPDFYGLPRNKTTITLTRTEWTVPDYYAYGEDILIPYRSGQTCPWKLSDPAP